MSRRYQGFLLLLPPLFVLGLGTVLFEISMTSSMENMTSFLRHLVQDERTHTPILHLEEIRSRYIWLTTVFLNIVVPLYAIGLAIATMSRLLDRQQQKVACAVIILLTGVGVILLLAAIKMETAVYRLVFGLPFFTFQESNHFDAVFLERVRACITTLNICSLLAPIVVLVAACSVVMSNRSSDVSPTEHLEARVRHLKGILNAGSALLVSGILHMDAWLKWPVALVSDPHIREALTDVTFSIALFWGAVFTMMLIATYGPAIGHLSLQAKRIVEQEFQAGGIPDPHAWLKERGLSNTFGEHLPQIVAMLGPVLAGPLGSTLMSGATGLG